MDFFKSINNKKTNIESKIYTIFPYNYQIFIKILNDIYKLNINYQFVNLNSLLTHILNKIQTSKNLNEIDHFYNTIASNFLTNFQRLNIEIENLDNELFTNLNDDIKSYSVFNAFNSFFYQIMKDIFDKENKIIGILSKFKNYKSSLLYNNILEAMKGQILTSINIINQKKNITNFIQERKKLISGINSFKGIFDYFKKKKKFNTTLKKKNKQMFVLITNNKNYKY